MAPMINGVKVGRHFQSLTSEPNNFAFEVKVTLCLNSTRPDNQVPKIELNGPLTYRIKVRRKIEGLAIDTNNTALEIKVILSMESTCLYDQEAKIELNGSYN